MKKLISFLKDDIWRIPTRKIDKRRSFFINQIRTLILSARGFEEDKCLLRASALTFYTLLSIVPVVAMAFGIAKGFGMEVLLERQLSERFQGHEEVLSRVMEFSRKLLETANGGIIAGLGVVILIWTVIKLIGNVESSFNDIWGIKEGRSIGRKFSDYLAMMMICPILLALSGSVTIFIATYLNKLTDFLEFYGLVKLSVNLTARTLPVLVIWVLFSFIYAFLPNTRVKIRSAIFAGLVAGILYQITQSVYIGCQFSLSKYNAIYGSLAALPFFL
ncbi:MAG TPA: YihY/virulence factor BrkB family protein, partial [Victivallales bacterium]|nr:YihY/virulence factor BrkB family protein [Victivallales bacterium]